MILSRHILPCAVFFCIFVASMDAQTPTLLSEFAEKPGYPELLENNAVELLDENSFYVSLMESISGAENYVLMESFIFSDGPLATRILDLLAEKVSQGVRCYLILDYVGCLAYLRRDFKRGYIESYKEKGVNIVFYNRDSFMPRNHRKLVIVDGKVAFTGGLNVTEKEGTYESGFYHDRHIKIEGPAVKTFYFGFFRMWNSCGNRPLDIKIPDAPAPAGDVPLVIIETAGCQSKPRTQDMLATLFDLTKDSLLIISPYILPDMKLRKDLINTAKRGVKIKILMGGTVDVPSFLYKFVVYPSRLLAEQKNIRFFIHPASFHHEKILISDGRLVWIGAHNLDIFSFYLDYELSVLLDNPEIAETLEKHFAACAEIEQKP